MPAGEKRPSVRGRPYEPFGRAKHDAAVERCHHRACDAKRAHLRGDRVRGRGLHRHRDEHDLDLPSLEPRGERRERGDARHDQRAALGVKTAEARDGREQIGAASRIA